MPFLLGSGNELDCSTLRKEFNRFALPHFKSYSHNHAPCSNLRCIRVPKSVL